MKRVKQTRLGKDGNCFEASMASLLDMRIEDVPDLLAYEDDGKWIVRINEWLTGMGLAYVEIIIPADQRQDFFTGMEFYHTIIGKTNRHSDVKHAVVGYKGEMVHDPHPDNAGVLARKALQIGVIVKGCKGKEDENPDIE